MHCWFESKQMWEIFQRQKLWNVGVKKKRKAKRYITYTKDLCISKCEDVYYNMLIKQLKQSDLYTDNN